MPEPLSGAARTALEGDLTSLLATTPGLTPLMAARRLQLRFSLLWTVLAPLLESGFLVVRGEGLVLESEQRLGSSGAAMPAGTGRRRA